MCRCICASSVWFKSHRSRQWVAAESVATSNRRAGPSCEHSRACQHWQSRHQVPHLRERPAQQHFGPDGQSPTRMSALLESSSGDDPGGGSGSPLGARAVLMEATLPSLPGDVQQALKAQLLGSKAPTINYEDALITLQLVLAKMQAKELQPRHMAWPSLAACIVLLADTSPDTLKARAECGFSHRELYWALEQDMLGYNCSKGIAKRFARCLPCAVGKPGKCGSGSAAWFCRRRLSVFDTRGTLLADKSQALLTYGETLLPSRSDGHALARGLTAAGEPEGLSRKCKCAPVGPEENKFVSCFDHITWNDKRLEGIATEDDKSETFVAQARTLLDTLEGMAPREQWQEVNIAATKRYVGCLKRLSGKDSNKRKMTVRADGEMFPANKADLKTTELKRWPDFDFFIGGDEPDDCLPEDLQKRSACFLNDATRAWAAEMQPTVYSMPPWHIRSGRQAKQGSDGPLTKRQRTVGPRASGKSGSKSTSSADELSTASLRIPSVTGGRPQLLAEAQPSGVRPGTPEVSLSSPLLRVGQSSEPTASGAVNAAASLQRQRSPSVPSVAPARSGGSNAPPTPHSPTQSSRSTRKTSISSLQGRGTAARDLLTSLVTSPQGGRGGPLQGAAGLLPDPSQLSSAFAGSFGGGGGGGGLGSQGHQQQVQDWRLPLGSMPSAGKAPRAPSLDGPLSGGGFVPHGWGSFGAGSLGTAAPAADGRQTAPRRASMRVDLAASDAADMLPRMGCPAGVPREECCPSLSIASLRTRGPLPPLAGGLGMFPGGSMHGNLPQVFQTVARHGSMLDFGAAAGGAGSGVAAPTARSRLASTGFGSMTDVPSAGASGNWSLGGTGIGSNGFGSAPAAAGLPPVDRLSAWRRDADFGGAGPSSGAGPSRGCDEAGPSSGAGPSRGGPTSTTPADDNAIFDGYLDDLLTFDELLMPLDADFDAGARPDSRGGAGPSTGGHLGGTLGEDLGGFCSNCWGKEEGCPACQKFLEELLMPSSPTDANPAAFAA